MSIMFTVVIQAESDACDIKISCAKSFTETIENEYSCECTYDETNSIRDNLHLILQSIHICYINCMNNSFLIRKKYDIDHPKFYLVSVQCIQINFVIQVLSKFGRRNIAYVKIHKNLNKILTVILIYFLILISLYINYIYTVAQYILPTGVYNNHLLYL